MKERPILFSVPMVLAILEGRKTQTRMAVNPQPGSVGGCYSRPDGLFIWTHLQVGIGCGVGEPFRCPCGVPGDRLWVRESLKWRYDGLGDETAERGHVYAADGEWVEEYIDQKPLRMRNISSSEMPRWASRLTLEVVNVRVERLHEISESDAIAEGVPKVNELWMEGDRPRAIAVYESVWDKINGVGSWALNPWVWVVEFKKVEQMEGLAR